MKKHYFISDIHLGLETKEVEENKEKILVNFLHGIKENADSLYIVGDLYDYWFEYRKVYQKGFFRTLNALYSLTHAGVKVYYVIGNHDFMHRDFFEKEIGVVLIPDSISPEIEGKKFFIAHGDGYVENDGGYKVLKKILRNKFLQQIYSLIHPDIGIWLASGTSKKSRNHTSKKDYGEADGLFTSAKGYIDLGYDFVVFGHLHQKQFRSYKTGTYLNLGSWIDKPCYGIFANNQFEIKDLD